MSLFEIILILIAVWMLIQGLLGIFFKETTIHLKGEKPVAIEGKWAVIASIAHITFSISLICFVIFFKTNAGEDFNFWAFLCCGALITFMVNFLASRRGILANWRKY